MTGFILGSAPKIWPFRHVDLEVIKGDELIVLKDSPRLPLEGESAALCLLLGLVGFLVLSALDQFHTRNNPVLRRLRATKKKA